MKKRVEDKKIMFIDPNDLIQFIPENEDEGENSIYEKLEHTLETGELTEEINKVLETPEEYIIKKQEDTRGRLAIIYTIATFIVFVLGIFASILDAILRQSSIINNLQVILPLMSGIFLGTLGFVIGYYFRKGEENG